MASAAVCEPDLSPRPWSALPAVEHHELPPRFLTALHEHALTKRAHELYGEGDALAFDFSQTIRGCESGWGIQAQFLRRLLAAVFPRASFDPNVGSDRIRVRILIVDSQLSRCADDHEIEMTNLKLANPGFDLPPPKTLRAWMGLPADGRVASVYSSWTYAKYVAEYVDALLTKHLADVVILSQQADGLPDRHQFAAAGAGKVEHYTDQHWIEAPGPRPTRALVFNRTRGRMPYVHAAADYAVVLGPANGAEPVHQGRPTFVSRTLRPGVMETRWINWVEALERSGGVRAFDDVDELARLIQAERTPPTHRLSEDPAILGRLLSQILEKIERFSR